MFTVLTPLQVAAALAMTNAEQDRRLELIHQEWDDDPMHGMLVASHYLISLFGLEAIDEQAERHRSEYQAMLDALGKPPH